jgi:ribonucleoside-diphosphate reductase alpha chain
MEMSSNDSYACCTLASINLLKFAGDVYDHARLHEVVRMVAGNLDNVIDANNYPVPECVSNASQYRPIGIGVQALADVFAAMRMGFLSPAAEHLDIEIMETIYHAALVESNERAKIYGRHKDFSSTPAARGILRFDQWAQNNALINSPLAGKSVISGRYDWDALKESIKIHGLRNSLHVALMPTVSTSQIMGNTEAFEPFSAILYTKTTISGKFTVMNTRLIRELIQLGIWNTSLIKKITDAKGAIGGITEIPETIRVIYQTVWEMKQSELIRRTALRSAFVDQSQSFNIHLVTNTDAYLRASFLKGWEYGLPTGSYYIRTRAATDAQKNNIVAAPPPVVEENEMCTMQAGCMSCGS